jgi:hypothetical protein
MAALLALHGIATPGVLVGYNGVVAFTGGATLPVGGAVLALSALPALRRPSGVRPLLGLQFVLLIAIIALGVVGMLKPSTVPGVPETGSRAADLLLIVGLGFYAILGLRALRTFLLTRRLADLASRLAQSRSARSWNSRRGACGRSRSAASCTTSASFPSPTRFSRSPAR